MPEAREITYDRQPLYPKQEAAIFHPARYAVIEASTKSGKTHGCVAWLFEQATQGGPGTHYWWLAPVQSQAQIAYRRLKELIPPGLARANATDATLTLANAATIWFKSAENPDHLYGEDVQAAVIDEATRVKEAAWHALRSTLSHTRGPVRIIGNVRGRRNWAYRMARRAEAGTPDMHYARLTATDAVEAGVLDAAEVDDAQRQLPAATFRELYFAEPAETYALVYASFGADNISAAAEYAPGAGPLSVGYDWGFTDPTHMGLYQLRDGMLYQFEELVGTQQPERIWVRRVIARVLALPDYRGPTLAEWEEIWAGRAAPAPHWPDVWPEWAVGDPSAVQLRQTFRTHGISAPGPDKVRHTVVSGQDVLRALIWSGEDRRRFVLHPRCTATREALENYRALDLGEGVYDARPDPDPANHVYSHGTAQARYLAWALRRRLGAGDP